MSLSVMLLFLLSVVSAGKLYAGQRVLFAFDSTGVHVHQVVKIQRPSEAQHFPSHDTDSDFRTAPVQGSAEKPGLKPGSIVMIWQDEKLQTLGESIAPDPRVAHTPFDGDRVDASRVGVAAGGWMADAPSEAARVIVLFPEHHNLGLPEQQWPLWLDVAGNG